MVHKEEYNNNKRKKSNILNNKNKNYSIFYK